MYQFARRFFKICNGFAANIKVLLDFFQKIAGVQGTASPVARRSGRNSHAIGLFFGGELKNIPGEYFSRGPVLQEKRGPSS